MKIIDPDSLIVSTTAGNLGVNGNIWLDTSLKTFSLAPFGDLVAKDGVTGNAIWAKFVDLWTTAAYQPFPFPMNVLDAKSGQYIFGQDPGGTYNGWKPLNDTTRQMIRDAGWSEYASNGDLLKQFVGIVSLGNVSTDAQLYYQKSVGGAAFDFTFTDEVNEGILVFEKDVSNTRTFFKGYVREYGMKYKDSILDDTGQTATGAYIVNLLLSNEDDLKITDNDVTVAASLPYTAIGLEYFGSDQSGYDIGVFPFRVVIDNTTANATLEEIYTKMQYNLRQDTDIDDGTGTVIGKTANSLCYFVGDTLYTTQGVFIDGVIEADLNRVVFLDQNGDERIYPYAASGNLNFNSALTSGGTGYYRMYITNSVTGNDDYGTANAITVNDKEGTPITGTISGAVMPFSFAYDSNIQGGRSVFTSPAGDVPVTVIAGNAGSAKPVVATGVITKSKSISITLTAETDRAYIV
jgi:hypothetical protein